jgi:hypothetical protein
MYENPTKYNETDLKIFNNWDSILDLMVKKGVDLNDSGEKWVIETAKFEKLNKRLGAFPRIDEFGFSYEKQGVFTTVSNKKYPLFLRCFYLMHPLCQKRAIRPCICDFRIFNKKYILELDDVIYYYPDCQREGYKKFHNHVMSKKVKAKIETPNGRRITYFYREHILARTSGFGIEIPFTIDRADLYSFINAAQKQADGEVLIEYIKRDINKCRYKESCNIFKTGCNRPTKMNIGGEDFVVPGCNFNISKKMSDEHLFRYDIEDFAVYQRFADVRAEQIDEFIRES